MIVQYIQEAMNTAQYEMLEDDGTFYGEIPACTGVYANADSLENCRLELESVLEDWLLLRIYRNLELPVINGVQLKVTGKAVA